MFDQDISNNRWIHTSYIFHIILYYLTFTELEFRDKNDHTSVSDIVFPII